MNNFKDILQQHPYYQVQVVDTVPLIVFEDHRFVVPVLWLAHRCGLIRSPVNMIRFDGHLDNLDFRADIMATYQGIDRFEDMFAFCESHLKKEDDDWVSFALQTNLINRVLTCYEYADPINPRYKERMTLIKRFDRMSDQEKMVWDDFVQSSAALLLDIDCDYFTFHWRGKIYPWPEEFYGREFAQDNRALLKRVVDRVPFITMCLESDFCAGRSNSQQILRTFQAQILHDKK